MQRITSKTNGKIKLLKSLTKKKSRYSEGLFFVEGYIVNFESPILPVYSVIDEKYLEEYGELINRYRNSGVEVILTNGEIIQHLSDTITPQGIISYYNFIDRSIKNLPLGQFLYLDGISDPGNLGTIIRTADAFNIDGVVVGENSVDLYNPKTIRSTMASIFRVPIYFGNLLDLENLSEYKIIATALENSIGIKECTFPENSIVVMGSEAHGVSEDILKMVDKRIKIPIREGVDSLNVAIATGIVLYELKC